MSYAVEAYPEGNQRYLSAESALYGRVFTEGLFGIVPEGFHSFTCSPRLPKGWDNMALHSIMAFEHQFDMVVSREGDSSKLMTISSERLLQEYYFRDGESVFVDLAELTGRHVLFRR